MMLGKDSSIRAVLTSWSAALSVVLVALAVILGFLALTQRDVARTERSRSDSAEIADELRQSSDDLTRMARLYVSTGAPRYRVWYDEILDIRDGLAPRPDRYGLVYWDLVLADGTRPRGSGEPVALEVLMAEAGFSEAEFGKLRLAQAQSDALTATESTAMNAVESLFQSGGNEFDVTRAADFERARDLMFNDDYMAQKTAIMEPINEFLEMIDLRTEQDIDELNNRARNLSILALTISLLTIIALAFQRRFVRERILSPLATVESHAARIRDGDYSQPVKHSSEDELGELVKTFNQMQTRLRETINQLETARETADAASEAKSVFVSSLSHELRTPLTSVLGFAQLLQLSLGDHPEQESVDHILTAGHHLLALIDEILEFSAFGLGTATVSMERVPLHEVVEECVELIAPMAAERDITVTNRTGHDWYALADRQRISQVLLNLLSNAIKYNHSYGVVTVYRSDTEGWARLSISDTGPGIAPELLQRIFAPFDRLDAAGLGIKGTGLGLALSKGLMEAMGGTIGVDSVLGQGSTFWLELQDGAVGPSVGTASTTPIGRE